MCESLCWSATPEAVSHLCYRESMHGLHTASFVATCGHTASLLCFVSTETQQRHSVLQEFCFPVITFTGSFEAKVHWWQSNFWSVCFDAKNWTQGWGLHILGKDSTIDNPTCTPFISVCCFVSFYFWNKALAGDPGYPWTHDLSVCPFWVSGSHQCEWKMALIFTKV